jgi:putative ABC transport system substrate-binding protein
MRRRWVAAAAAAVLVATVPHVRAQPPEIPVVAYLDGASVPTWFDAFRTGLRDLGYVEDRTIIIRRRSAAGPTAWAELADDFVRLRPRVIVASGSLPALAAKKATATIPIVVAFATDPVELGLVPSLARPDGNVTGMSNMGGGLMGKRIELLAEMVPGTRLAVVWSPAVAANHTDYRDLQTAASALNLELHSLQVLSPDQYDEAFRQASLRAGRVAVLSGPMAFRNREIIIAAAARHKVAAIYYDAEYARSGGLVSYGPGLVNLHRRAAIFVDKILKGARPSDLPVEQPTQFELAVNLKAARELGIEIPATVLARADEVIE